jgi:hypothetical protein
VLIIDTTYGYATFDGTNLVRVGSVGTITITSGGSAYSAAPTVTISAPNEVGGVQATATATISGGVVTAITITEPGTGYTSAPTITFSSGAASATATAISQPGTCIQSFSGRVWIADGRTIYYTAADSYNDFTSISAGNITLVDGTLYGDITQIIAANNFLYIFGESSINVFSDVRVNTLGETLFTNTNISASIGTELFLGVFAYFRSILFINRYGVYALVGATTTKISDALDGIFPNIDFSSTVTGCQTLIYNILVSAWNVRYNDNGTYRRVQLVFFDRKWFISYQGNLTHINSSPVNGLINAYGVESGGAFFRMYEDQTANISTEVVTALWDLKDPIRDKQALKLGVEATFPVTVAGSLNISIDSESRASTSIALGNAVAWQNNSFNNIAWTNNAGSTLQWISSGYQLTEGYKLLKYDAQMYGKYLGMTVTSTAPAFTFNGFQLEHELRARF